MKSNSYILTRILVVSTTFLTSFTSLAGLSSNLPISQPLIFKQEKLKGKEARENIIVNVLQPKLRG